MRKKTLYVELKATCLEAITSVFFFNDTATTEIYTLALHDALPISSCARLPTTPGRCTASTPARGWRRTPSGTGSWSRSEEHTSELQSRQYLVCRLLLEKTTNRSTATAHARSNAPLLFRLHNHVIHS